MILLLPCILPKIAFTISVATYKSYMQLSKNGIGPTGRMTCQTYNGGGERDRTDDPLRARQVLSQLSYTPNLLGTDEMVGLGGLEPPTSRLSVVCSSQLSYRPPA
jgi:hypothetical protein